MNAMHIRNLTVYLEKVLAFVKGQKLVTAKQVASHFKISRQMAARHLGALIKRNLISKTGSTKMATYSFGSTRQPALPHIKMVKALKNLEEHEVYTETDHRLQLKSKLKSNVYDILNYVFTEMLNNAIDHSRSLQAQIEIKFDGEKIYFVISDQGIGVFANVMKFFKLQDEWAAAEHLLKGKQTTMSSRHSGEGIFFTSKIADRFELQSHKTILIFDNKKEDVALKEQRFLRGTRVIFVLNLRSKKNLQELFDKYSDKENYEFFKSGIKLGLQNYIELISRSQARRVLLGLDKFKYIVFDFANVPGIGQAFADEIFRVFATKNPGTVLEPQNMNQAVNLMVKRALQASK